MTDDLSFEERVESEVLARALATTDRKAVAARKESSNPLHDPTLVCLARRSLGDALGPLRHGPEPFPMTVWKHGAEHVGKKSPGVTYTGSIDTFVKILEQRAQIVAPKKSGWVVEPTTNRDGLRTNDSTLFMHAIFLDCDNTGTWERTLAALSGIGLAYIAYQSSGYQLDTPKWRVVLPLATPFSVLNDLERAAWKKLYHRVRVLVGALGELREEGFDPRTDAPSIPWFCTERRIDTDTPRQAVFRPGASLDVTALALSLPPVIDGEDEKKRKHNVSGIITERGPLDDAEIDEIVSALAKVTNSVPRGRRDIYLALPGVLLDRGVHPDDVMSICTEVSLAYPRKHADKHADNVHSCKTTITKFLAKDPTYTRIGTLQAACPEVAAVVDRFVPDLVQQGLRDSMVEGVAIHDEVETQELSIPVPPPTIQVTRQGDESKKRSKKNLLRKRLEKLAEERTALPDVKRSTAGIVLGRVLQSGFGYYIDVRLREDAIKEVFSLIGFEMGVGDKAVSFDQVLEALDMLGKISAETYKQGATEFSAAVGRRVKWDDGELERAKKRDERKSQEHAEILAKIESRRQKAMAGRR